MQSIAQVQNVQKINAVSTGKVANEKSMMVWRPHGNKYVSIPNFPSSRVLNPWISESSETSLKIWTYSSKIRIVSNDVNAN
jgi:hypothetical protein